MAKVNILFLFQVNYPSSMSKLVVNVAGIILCCEILNDFFLNKRILRMIYVECFQIGNY